MNRKLLLILSSLFLLLGQCCFSNQKVDTRAFFLPDSILREIERAVQAGNFSCAEKTLFSRSFFALDDERLLILIGIPDYLCSSNSFLPVVADGQGGWQSGPPLPGAPSWLVRGADGALWLAAQWQVEGTFPALYRSLDGVDWEEIALPENRGVDCCFERLVRICFPQGLVRLEFAGDAAGKAAWWETGLAGIAVPGPGPAWRPVAEAWDGSGGPCPFVPLGQGPWVRIESERSHWILFRKNRMYSRVSLVVPGALDREPGT